MINILQTFFLVILLKSIYSEKLFLANTNYLNRNNWKNKIIPCPYTHVLLPYLSPTIYLYSPESLKITYLRLPNDGDIILANGVSILPIEGFGEHKNCDIIQASYIKDTPDYWYDIKNWCQLNDSTRACLDNKFRSVEASVIPSASDVATFPDNAMFYVALKENEPKIMLRRLNIRNETFYNSFRLRQKLRHTHSDLKQRLEFINLGTHQPPVINLRKNVEKNEGNSNLKIMSTICSYVKCPTVSSDTKCEQDGSKLVQPIGSCCSLCNAWVYEMKFLNPTYKLQFMEMRSAELIQRASGILANDASLVYDVLSTKRYYVQFTIAVKTKSVKSNTLLRATKELEKQILKFQNDWGIVKVNIENKGSSGALIMPSHGLGLAAKVVIILIFILGVLLLLTLLVMKRTPFAIPEFKFSNWSNIQVPSINLPNISAPSSMIRRIIHQWNPFTSTQLDESVNQSFKDLSTKEECIELPETVGSSSRYQDISFANPMFDEPSKKVKTSDLTV